MRENAIDFVSENPSSNLLLFKQCIEENRSGLQHHPYSLYKGKLMAYKTIFLVLSLFFFALAAYLWVAPFNWACHFLFGDFDNLRLLATGLCAMIGATSMITGTLYHPSEEIGYGIYKKAKRKLHKYYQRKAETLLHGSATYSHSPYKKQLRFIMEEYLDSMEEIREEAFLIMKRIRISRAFNEGEKEELYNETLFELHCRLNEEVQDFQR